MNDLGFFTHFPLNRLFVFGPEVLGIKIAARTGLLFAGRPQTARRPKTPAAKRAHV
jgi:hypothetical protein